MALAASAAAPTTGLANRASSRVWRERAYIAHPKRCGVGSSRARPGGVLDRCRRDGDLHVAAPLADAVVVDVDDPVPRLHRQDGQPVQPRPADDPLPPLTSTLARIVGLGRLLASFVSQLRQPDESTRRARNRRNRPAHCVSGSSETSEKLASQSAPDVFTSYARNM